MRRDTLANEHELQVIQGCDNEEDLTALESGPYRKKRKVRGSESDCSSQYELIGQAIQTGGDARQEMQDTAIHTGKCKTRPFIQGNARHKSCSPDGEVTLERPLQSDHQYLNSHLAHR